MRLMPMADRPRYYVSLGDSMSIDVYAGGPGCGGPSLLYRNRDDDFPEWKGRDLQSRLPGARLIPLATDSGTSATVRFSQIPRLKEMNIRPAVITVTMGGNDLLQTFGSDENAHAARRALWENSQAALAELRALAGSDAAILVGTIYDPGDGSGDAEAMEMRAWPNALAWIRDFNETLRAVAGEHGAVVADIHARFQGHGLSVGNPAQFEARPRNRNLWYCGGIEPNAWGASGIRETFWDALESVDIVTKKDGGANP